MSTDNKTLADVQPGGRVRLGDRATQEMVDAGAAALLAYRKSGGDYTVHPTHAAEAAINAALSVRRCCGSDRCAGHSAIAAQPSPGGQDALAMIGANLRSIVHLATVQAESTNNVTVANIHTEARHALQLLDLAARQPVGERPDIAKVMDRCIRELQSFIDVAHDYDLDEMAVQSLLTDIESMELRKKPTQPVDLDK